MGRKRKVSLPQEEPIITSTAVEPPCLDEVLAADNLEDKLVGEIQKLSNLCQQLLNIHNREVTLREAQGNMRLLCVKGSKAEYRIDLTGHGADKLMNFMLKDSEKERNSVAQKLQDTIDELACWDIPVMIQDYCEHRKKEEGEV